MSFTPVPVGPFAPGAIGPARGRPPAVAVPLVAGLLLALVTVCCCLGHPPAASGALAHTATATGAATTVVGSDHVESAAVDSPDLGDCDPPRTTDVTVPADSVHHELIGAGGAAARAEWAVSLPGTAPPAARPSAPARHHICSA